MSDNIDVLLLAFVAFAVGSVIGALALKLFGPRRGGPPPESGD